MQRRIRRRRGFTLVELLVAVALIVFIMVILSEAFSKSLQAFRVLKAIGDMDAKLRTASTVLRSDLTADHFEGKRRLSDANFWVEGPPREGFFRWWQGTGLNTAPANAVLFYTIDASDISSNDRIDSRRAVDHALHFTVKKRGNNPADVFSARLLPTSPVWGLSATFFNQPPDARYLENAQTITSQWAEVSYFLRPAIRLGGNLATQGDWTTANGSRLYTLYRRQRLVLPNNLATTAVAGTYADHANLACMAGPNPGTLTFLSPTDLTIPERRFGMAGSRFAHGSSAVDPFVLASPLGQADATIAQTRLYPSVELDTGDPSLTGGDVLMGDVLSFEVRALFRPRGDFLRLDEVTTRNSAIVNPADLTFPATQRFRIFDTWSTQNVGTSDYSTAMDAVGSPLYPPVTERILAFEITIRVWDFKTEQARQITIIQEM